MKIRRILKVTLTSLLILSLIMVITPEKVKASGYDPEAALAYAAEHWNDGKGLCAEFVSDCVIAGGLDMPVCPMVYYCVPAIINASGVQPQTLKLDSWGLATKELDGDILAPGDVVFHYCNTHPDSIRVMPHIIICAGYDEEGYAVYYAHNGACNKRRIRLNINTAYEHERDCDMVGKVIHLSGGPSGYSPQGANFFNLPGENTAVSADNIIINKSVIINDAPVSNIRSVSFKITDDEENVLAEKEITYSIDNDIVKLNVDVKQDVGVTLEEGKYYFYEFSIEVGQRKIKSARYSVLATEISLAISDDEEELSMDSYLDAVYDPSAARDDILSRTDGNLLSYQKPKNKEYTPRLLNAGKIMIKSAKSIGYSRIDTRLSTIFSKNGFGLNTSSFNRYNNYIKKIRGKRVALNNSTNETYRLYIVNSELGRWAKHLLRVRG